MNSEELNTRLDALEVAPPSSRWSAPTPMPSIASTCRSWAESGTKVDTEKGPVQVSGLYHDRFERRNGKWAFLSRRFELHFLTPLNGWVPVAGEERFAPSEDQNMSKLREGW